MEDKRIIDLFWSRSEQAIEVLSHTYGALVRSIVLRIVGDGRDAEECINDTYLGVWNAIPPARPEPLVAFVSRVARNVALKRRRYDLADKRDAGITLPAEELQGCLPTPLSVEEEYTSKQLGVAIDRFLGTLSKEDRVLFVRRYWFSEPVDSLAAQRGMRANTVSARLSRIRKRLRAYLEKEEQL